MAASELIDLLQRVVGDRYRLERELGRGGMATVYLAEDVRHHRNVAVKVLQPELAAALGGERFLREIEVTAGLQHPHILPLHDSGEAGGLLYYVMPYVEGESLRARLERERQLPVSDAVRIATEVAAALDYAHRHGVVHRDVKPENILLHDGRALVADFGIAVAVQQAGGVRLTETGLSLGTPQYMAPEQAAGERTVDARADVYALGAVTYEVLAGEPPFTGPTAQVILAKVVTKRPQPLRTQRRTVPPALETAILRALEKLPADRWATARDFGNAVARSATMPGDLIEPTAAREFGVSPVRRRAWLGWAAAALATLAALWGWLRPSQSAPSYPPSRLAIVLPNLGGTATPLQRQLALTPDGSTIIFVAAGQDGYNRVWRQSLADAEPTLIPGIRVQLADLVVSPDGRSFAMVRRSPATRIMVIQNLPELVRRLGGGAGRAR